MIKMVSDLFIVRSIKLITLKGKNVCAIDCTQKTCYITCFLCAVIYLACNLLIVKLKW